MLLALKLQEQKQLLFILYSYGRVQTLTPERLKTIFDKKKELITFQISA